MTHLHREIGKEFRCIYCLDLDLLTEEQAPIIGLALIRLRDLRKKDGKSDLKML